MNKLKQEIMAAATGEICCDSAQSITRRYIFGDKFSGFSGHFPDKPILPAIVQILTVISLVEEHTGKEHHLKTVESAKFLNPVVPGQEVLVHCQQQKHGDKLLFDACLTVQDRQVATFLIHLDTGSTMP